MTALSISDIIRLEIELTNTCNLDCPLCLRQIHPELTVGKVKYRPATEIIAQLETYKNIKYITIAGAISEPTLHPELFDILKYCISRDLEISLFINGDTHNELYYKKLGLIFMKATGKVFFTICGSTQELHSKYRVNSNLSTVLSNLDIIQKYSGKAVMTWIVFNYNEEDFNDNFHKFQDKYETEYFYTLPMDEHFELNSNIHLPQELQKIYAKVDRNDFKNIECPANNYKFILIDSMGFTNPCSLYKLYGDKHCFECSSNNSRLLRENKIYKVAEPESEDSEQELRI